MVARGELWMPCRLRCIHAVRDHYVQRKEKIFKSGTRVSRQWRNEVLSGCIFYLHLGRDLT